jgi:hypothetical protein
MKIMSKTVSLHNIIHASGRDFLKECIKIPHKNQMNHTFGTLVSKGHVRYYHHLVSVNIYLFIFSESSEPTGRVVHWMVSYKVYGVLFCWLEVHKETRVPKVSKRVCPYIWVYLWSSLSWTPLKIEEICRHTTESSQQNLFANK